MADDFKTLISNAAFLTEDQKRMYLVMADNLDETKKTELLKIISAPANQQNEIKTETAKEKSEAIKEFLTTCEDLFQKEKKSVMHEEEETEKQGADQILNQLKDA